MELKDLKSETINELATALSKAQAEIKGASKDAQNPFFKSKYADLSSVWEACKIPLTKNSLSITQITMPTEKGTVLITTLMHSSGQWISSAMPIRPAKDDLQGVGSALTYCRRYSLAAIVGVAPEDDDGESAMSRSNPQSNPKTTPKQATPLPKAQPPHYEDIPF